MNFVAVENVANEIKLDIQVLTKIRNLKLKKVLILHGHWAS